MSMTFAVLLELLRECVEHLCNAMTLLQDSKLLVIMTARDSACKKVSAVPSDAQL